MPSTIANYASTTIAPSTSISENASDEGCKRIRRGFQAHHDHTEMFLHLQDQYREVYKRYVQDLAQRDRPER